MGTVTTVNGDTGGVFACTIVTVGTPDGDTNTVLGVAGATATIAGHCRSFRSLEILCCEAALLGKGSVGSVIEIGDGIFPEFTLEDLLHPRNSKEDRICAGIAGAADGGIAAGEVVDGC